jgi:tetratricopeptide (TPR) repeat protein
MMVNYHAFAEWFRARGGEVLQTPHRHVSLCVCGFVLGPALEAAQAFEREVVRGGPDDFFTLKRSADAGCDKLSLPEILASLRRSAWDPRAMLACLPTLTDLVDNASETARQELWLAIQRVWDLYYPIGEDRDLAFGLGVLLCKMGYFREALDYLGHSVRLHGSDPSTHYNMARCHHQLREIDAAIRHVDRALELAPDFTDARNLRLRLLG